LACAFLEKQGEKILLQKLLSLKSVITKTGKNVCFADAENQTFFFHKPSVVFAHDQSERSREPGPT
jgi:hypothetical protein